MKKSPRRNIWVDRFHKGFVYTCLGVTIISTGMLCLKAYDYFVNIKPQLKQQQLLKQNELLAEGSSDSLQDKTPALQA